MPLVMEEVWGYLASKRWSYLVNLKKLVIYFRYFILDMRNLMAGLRPLGHISLLRLKLKQTPFNMTENFNLETAH